MGIEVDEQHRGFDLDDLPTELASGQMAPREGVKLSRNLLF